MVNPKQRLRKGQDVLQPREELSDALRRVFAARADIEQIAFRSRSGARHALTGAELSVRAGAMAETLRAWLGPGPRSLVLAMNAGEEVIVTLLGGMLAGITVVPVPVPRKGTLSDRFSHIVSDSRAGAVLCQAEHLDEIRSTLHQDGGAECPVVALPLDLARLPEPAPAVALEGSPAIIQYTSGSTRLPKGVLITGQNVLANCGLGSRNWGIGTDARFVNWLPHYHDMGLMGGILYPLLCGGFSAQMSPLDFIRQPASWLQAVTQERANFSGGPAFAFAECLTRIPEEEIAALDLNCWTRAFCGAEPVPARLLAEFRARFAPVGLDPRAVFACYGLAEMTLFAGGAPGAERIDLQGDNGLAPCFLTPELRGQVKIVDPDGDDTRADGQEGEIWLRGPSQGAGYLGLPEETAATFHQQDDGSGGWLRSGDLGVIVGDDLYVTGRIKDTIICNGRNLSAPEVEWRACQVSDLLNPFAAAVIMPETTSDNRVVLLAEVRDGPPPADQAALSAAIERALLGEWGLSVEEVRVLPRGTLPRTSSGKIRRKAAAQLWRSGALRDMKTVA